MNDVPEFNFTHFLSIYSATNYIIYALFNNCLIYILSLYILSFVKIEEFFFSYFPFHYKTYIHYIHNKILWQITDRIRLKWKLKQAT